MKSSQPIPGVLTDLERGEYLATTIRTQEATISPALVDIYGVLSPDGQGDVLPPHDWMQTQLTNASLLDDGVSSVRMASKAHRSAKIKSIEATGARNELGVNLRTHYRALQKTFEAGCGPKSLQLVGLDIPAISSMLSIREQYGLVHDQIQDRSLPAKLAGLAATVIGGSVPDLAALSAEMARQIDAFEVSQNALVQARKDRDQAYAAKKAARKRLRTMTVNLARVQEGYYRLAGFDDLADRMRLTIRSKSKKKDPDGSTPLVTDDSTIP